MSLLGRLFKKRPPPRDQFVMDVIAELAKHGRKPAHFDAAAYALKMPDGEIGLLNTFNHWVNLDGAAKGALVTRFVNGASAAPKFYSSLDEIAEDLVPLVRSRTEISAYMIENQIIGGPGAKTNKSANIPFVGDLVIALGIDRPDTIERVTTEGLEKISATFEKILPVAMTNLAKKIKPTRFQPLEARDAGGIYYGADAEDYQSSLLLLPPDRFFDLPQLDGDPVIHVPTRNQMFVTGSRNDAGLRVLAKMAGSGLDELPHRCTSMLLRHDSRQWVPFTPEPGSELAALYARTLKTQDALDYANQKNRLEELHRLRNEDIFVGEQMHFERDGQSFSAAAWSSGVTAGLMPRAESIVFIEQTLDPESGAVTGHGDTLRVAWENAMPIVQRWLEEVPDLYPPRYRYCAFPDAAAMDALKALAIAEA